MFTSAKGPSTQSAADSQWAQGLVHALTPKPVISLFFNMAVEHNTLLFGLK